MNAAFLTDGYKLDHRRQYPNGTQQVYATWIPRSNKHYPEADKVVVFGVQYTLKKITEYWNDNFFSKPIECVYEWKRLIDAFLGPNEVGLTHIAELHALGYLPIEVYALPEGTVTNVGIPHAVIVNTDERFAWITNYLETAFSMYSWLPSTSATTARLALKNLHNHAKRTGWTKEQIEGIPFLCHDFSMRGMPGLDAAISSGMGHMTSWVGTETVPAVKACEMYYKSNVEEELVAATVPATEHSVMCAGGNESEIETFRRLLKLYPTGYLSIVSDTWDYWNVITNILPQLKDEIMARDGRLVIRPDSGDPVDIICGESIYSYAQLKKDIPSLPEERLNREIGTYEVLWNIFGGTINEAGYKVLDSHIGIIYGDAITLERQLEIYQRLTYKKFAATNIVLGFGSYTYNGKTRDSLGWALKTTAVKINGEWKEVFKDPKTVTGMPKKSLRGFCGVFKDEHGECFVTDQLGGYQDIAGNELVPIYQNGMFLKEVSLSEIRSRIKQSI